MQCGIPVWVRNTFAPENSGTKIAPDAHPIDDGVKAVTAVNQAALITVHPPSAQNAPEVVERMIAAADAARADVLIISCSALQDRIEMVVATGVAERVVAGLRGELNSHLKGGDAHLSVDSTVSLLTVVGQDLHAVDGIVGRATRELARQHVEVLATAHGASKCNVSFVVHRRDAHLALLVTHREFDSGAPKQIAIDRTQAQAI
jgi:aspartokinase